MIDEKPADEVAVVHDVDRVIRHTPQVIHGRLWKAYWQPRESLYPQFRVHLSDPSIAFPGALTSRGLYVKWQVVSLDNGDVSRVTEAARYPYWTCEKCKRKIFPKQLKATSFNCPDYTFCLDHVTPIEGLLDALLRLS